MREILNKFRAFQNKLTALLENNDAERAEEDNFLHILTKEQFDALIKDELAIEDFCLEVSQEVQKIKDFPIYRLLKDIYSLYKQKVLK